MDGEDYHLLSSLWAEESVLEGDSGPADVLQDPVGNVAS